MTLTVTDLFCGAGGSSTGLTEAGLDVRLAANHWRRAIETHSANHPATDHLCADINNLDMRRLPRTDLLWASVICTESSPAAGKRRTRGQLALLEHGPIDDAAFVRTRATALDVVRATEVHRYAAVVVENVPEFATDWELFGWWVRGMELLGYRHQVTSVSSAHVGGPGNPAAPQWRNRIYITLTRTGIPAPDLDPRPLAWCESCGADVAARQAWNPGRSIGAYREQYRYVCPNTTCRHATVEPYVRPAASVIDWTNPGKRIGDKPRKEFFADKARTRSLGLHPLAPTTMAKIRAGLAAYTTEPHLVAVNHGGTDARAVPAGRAPLPTRTGRIGDGLVCPPGAFIAELRGGGSTHRPVTQPLATVAASGNHHGLVIPYRRCGVPYPTDLPLHTLSTRDSAALLHTDPTSASGTTPVAVEDAWFRMIQPREQLLAQRFPAGYVVHGNKGEQTVQAGNAVSVNAACWIGRQLLAALDSSAAA
jgi:DNA (cytosine-5)-methyltransferase 1